jgi:5-methylcytosine-specific restriction endonuclease McrA
MAENSWAIIRRQVYDRAGGICEYCRTNEANTGLGMQIDHIDPDGGDELNNLCLACANCNGSKHKVTSALDPVSQHIAPLFNPRIQQWADHFEWIEGGTQMRGLTPTGRATVMRLQVNRPKMVSARMRWVQNGYHPPD